MKITIMGLGSIGKRHLKSCFLLKDEMGIKEIKVYDTNPARLKDIDKEISEFKACKTVREAMSDTNAVFICVPTAYHLNVFKEISSFGSFHLYIEKPLSHELKGCQEVVLSQKRASKTFMVGYMLPFHPLIQRIKAILNSEILGRILSVRAESGFYLPKWHPKEDYRKFYMASKTAGGGVLLDTSHEINYLQWLFGEISEVKGYVTKISDLEITSDDLCLALLKFQSGIIGEIHLDLLQFEEARNCKIIGSDGVLIGDLMKNCIRMFLEKENVWSEEMVQANYDDIYLNQARKFLKACSGEKSAFISGEEGLRTMKVIEAIRESHESSSGVNLI